MPGIQNKKNPADTSRYRLGLSINEQSMLQTALEAYRPYDSQDADVKFRVLNRLKKLKTHRR